MDIPPLMYHVSDPSRRRSIEIHGLQPLFDMTGLSAVYLSTEPLSTDQDVWKVYTRGLKIVPDSSTPGFENEWFMTYDPIPPDRIRLMEDHELDQYGDIYQYSSTMDQVIKRAKTSALQGLPQNAFGPNEHLKDVAQSYMQTSGMPYNPPSDYTFVDPQRASQIAQAYDKMEHKPDDPEVQASYNALKNETRAQYDHLVNNGYKFEFYPQGIDPYPQGPRGALEDLKNNKHLFVYPTHEGYGQGGPNPTNHPILGDSGIAWNGLPVTHNDLFRAVHDAFGHGKEGVGFRADGEDNAWRQHASMFSPQALPAMTSETRGQNSWVNFGPHGAENQTANQENTIYADQKAGLLPSWVHTSSWKLTNTVEDRVDEHFDAVPFIYENGIVYLGYPEEGHTGIVYENANLRRKYYVKGDEEVAGNFYDTIPNKRYVGRIFPDGEILDWNEESIPEEIKDRIRQKYEESIFYPHQSSWWPTMPNRAIQESLYYHKCPMCGGYLTQRGDFFTCSQCPFEWPPNGEKKAATDDIRDQIREVAESIIHCGDYGQCYWDPKKKKVFWNAADSDGPPLYTSISDIEERFKAIPGVQSVEVADEYMPEEGSGYERIPYGEGHNSRVSMTERSGFGYDPDEGNHCVVGVETPTGTYLVDWSASQYGYPEFPMVQKLDNGSWQRNWTSKIASGQVIQLPGASIPVGTKWVLDKPTGTLWYWYTDDDLLPTHMVKMKGIKDSAPQVPGDQGFRRWIFGADKMTLSPEEILANPDHYYTFQDHSQSTYASLTLHRYSDTIDRPMTPEDKLTETLAGDPAASKAYQALTDAGGKVYVVGGAVRDAVLGNTPKDTDLMATGLTGDQIHSALAPHGRVDLTGKQFGVYRLRHNGGEVEVAMPRTEQSTGDAHTDFQVAADPNLPVEDDLKRRDFTVNAMAYDPAERRVIDPYGGTEHAHAKQLSLVNENAFRDDPLRIVRALVAQSKHGLVPDQQLEDKMRESASQIRHLPGERIQMEMDKLLSGKDPVEALRTAYRTGVMDYLAPELSAMENFDQKNPHHDLPVDKHTFAALNHMKGLSNDPDKRLAILFHDSGKPESFWQDPALAPDGGGHFYKKINPDGTTQGDNHEDAGARLVREFMNRNNYSNARKQRVEKLVQNHMFKYFDTEKGARKFLREAGDPKTAFDLLDIRESDANGKSTTGMTEYDTQALAKSKQLLQKVLDDESATTVKDLAINGSDLIKDGMKAGPEIGKVLNELLERVIDDPSINNRETLMEMARKLR